MNSYKLVKDYFILMLLSQALILLFLVMKKFTKFNILKIIKVVLKNEYFYNI